MRQIEQALIIASEGSINRAAKKLYLSQPNLSASLRDLEQELGQPLFVRSEKGAALTAFGREFLSFAQPAYRQFKLLGSFCVTMRQPSQLRFSVASQYFRFANTLFSEVCREYQDVPYHFSFLEGSVHAVTEMVRSQEAEIGLVILSPMERQLFRYSFRQSELSYRCLASEELAIIVGAHHPLCADGAERVTLEELGAYPFAIYRDADYGAATMWKELGIDGSKQRITVQDRATLYELLAGTNAYTIGTHNVRAYESTDYYQNIRILRVKDRKIFLEIGCITGENHPLSPPANRYLELLEEAVTRRNGG